LGDTPKPPVLLGDTPKPSVLLGDTPKPSVLLGDTPKPPGRASFPFCSPACKLVDLGRWLDGSYRLPVLDGDPGPELARREAGDGE
jgi:endogenous inhibitor of DNA gyrase (YacG/DUF329 family)